MDFYFREPLTVDFLAPPAAAVFCQIEKKV